MYNSMYTKAKNSSVCVPIACKDTQRSFFSELPASASVRTSALPLPSSPFSEAAPWLGFPSSPTRVPSFFSLASPSSFENTLAKALGALPTAFFPALTFFCALPKCSILHDDQSTPRLAPLWKEEEKGAYPHKAASALLMLTRLRSTPRSSRTSMNFWKCYTSGSASQ